MAEPPRNPYEPLGPDAFWRTGVVEGEAQKTLYRPKFKISADTGVMTAGSCFAQHLTAAMRAAGLALIDAEQIDAPALSDAMLTRFGYRQYSARYGNIYTARQMWQLMEEALGGSTPREIAWARDDRFFDALRPTVEPLGYESPRQVRFMREKHLACVRKAIEETDVLVFTLGLTEAWINRHAGTVFPTAPGAIAGIYRPRRHGFINLGFDDTMGDLERMRSTLRAVRPDARIILTVSPVPLTATASGQHVLQATTHSKAILRAAAGEFAARYNDVDYFPSYEIVLDPAHADDAFDTNLRTPTQGAVQRVISAFLAAHGVEAADQDVPGLSTEALEAACEEALLDAFAPS